MTPQEYTKIEVSDNGKTVQFYTGTGYGGGEIRRYRNVTQSSLERLFGVVRFVYQETRNTKRYTSNEIAR